MKDLRRFAGHIVRPGYPEEQELVFDGVKKLNVNAMIDRLSVGEAIIINRIDDADQNAI